MDYLFIWSRDLQLYQLMILMNLNQNGLVQLLQVRDQMSDLEVKNKDGATPLHRASRNGHPEVAELLLARGAEVNAVDRAGATSLMIASANGHEFVVGQLLSHDADVNHLAAKHTAQTARNHKCSNNVDIVLCNGLDAFRTRRLFDVLMCNPPYVPTEDEEIYTTTPETTTNHNSVINAAFAGGEKGRLLVDSVLMPQLADYLWKEGRAYVVALHENDVGEIQQDAKARGLESQVVMERRADMERLCVLRFTTTTTTTTL